MKALNFAQKSFISSGLILILVFTFSGSMSAQSSNSADKNWNAYWTKFNTAVKSKNHKSIIALTSKKFFSPSGEKIGGWVKDANNWRRLKNSVSKGTKTFACKKICRITRNADSTFGLVFVFENNRWSFIGERGE
jgi:hypothetical protein